MHRNKHGFTLVEMIIVLAIIGLLAATITIFVRDHIISSRDAKRKNDMITLSKAAELYSTNNGVYPTNSSSCDGDVVGRIAGDENSGGSEDLCAGTSLHDNTEVYMPSIPDDPNPNNPYQYEGDGSTFCVSANLEKEDIFVCQNGTCFFTLFGCE